MRNSASLTLLPVVRRLYVKIQDVPVFGRLARRAARTLMPNGTRIWIRVKGPQSDAIWLSVDPRFDSDLIDGNHEPAVQAVLQETLKPGECFYDLGAHIGLFSLIAAELVGKSGQVFAFEPDLANTEVLAANAKRNKIPIDIVQAAGWSSTGVLRFERSHPQSSGMQGHVCSDASPVSQAIEVSGIALDDFVYTESHNPPDFVKIDVEGAESEVLKGGTRTLRECKPSILCEIHDAPNSKFVESFLMGLGYQLRWLEGTSSAYPTRIFAQCARNEFA